MAALNSRGKAVDDILGPLPKQEKQVVPPGQGGTQLSERGEDRGLVEPGSEPPKGS